MENQIQTDIPQPNVSPVELVVQSSTPPPTNLPKIILLGLVGLIVVGGLVFAGIQIGKGQTTNEQPIIVQPTVFPTQTIVDPTVTPVPPVSTTIPTVSSTVASPTINPTANWKTYIDTKYRYSFRYPTSWVDKTVQNDKDIGNFTIESAEGEKIHGTVFSGIADIENDKKNNGSSKSIIINEQKYLLITYVECDGPGCSLSRKHLDVFNQILSTFKFLE